MRAFWLLVAAVVGGVLVWQGRPWFEQRTAPAVEAVPRVIEPRGDLASDEKSTIELFERSKGSVVFITTTQLVRDLWSRSMFSIPRGAGSGFVWDNDGHVITNNHVVRGAAEAKVRLNDGRDYSARLVGESAGLKVGQKVFAIGNPFGLDWSLTTGVVSALDRALPAEDGRSIAGRHGKPRRAAAHRQRQVHAPGPRHHDRRAIDSARRGAARRENCARRQHRARGRHHRARRQAGRQRAAPGEPARRAPRRRYRETDVAELGALGKGHFLYARRADKKAA